MIKVGDIVTINRAVVAHDHPALQNEGKATVTQIEGRHYWVKPSQASPVYVMDAEELVEAAPEAPPIVFSPSAGTFVSVAEDDADFGAVAASDLTEDK